MAGGSLDRGRWREPRVHPSVRSARGGLHRTGRGEPGKAGDADQLGPRRPGPAVSAVELTDLNDRDFLGRQVKGSPGPARYTSMVQGDGGSGSFERFFAATKDDVFRSLLLITRDRSLADDGVAEAFTRALERWPDVSAHPVPKAWVARTALNYVRSDRRRFRWFAGGVPDVAEREQAPPDPQLIERVLRLPKRQREVIALRILLDLSEERTAELLGIAPGTVGAHLSNALARLERELSAARITEVEG